MPRHPVHLSGTPVEMLPSLHKRDDISVFSYHESGTGPGPPGSPSFLLLSEGADEAEAIERVRKLAEEVGDQYYLVEKGHWLHDYGLSKEKDRPEGRPLKHSPSANKDAMQER
jgi:hypothetical protein